MNHRKQINIKKIRINRVPTLVLSPKVQRSSVAVLWIHGGGYFLGMKEMVYISRALELVSRYGVTVFSPGYRLAFRAPYPAAVEDCYQILQFLAASKEFDHIIVGGESAGGGLAAAVCMMARDRGLRVAYQFPLYPMLNNLDTQSSCNNHGRIWNTRRNHLGWKLYLRKDAKNAVSPYAAPAHQTDYHDLPPCYTFVGDGEPFYCETLTYIHNLKNAGIKAEVDIYPTDMHAFDMLKPKAELSRLAIERFLAHFEEALHEIQ